MRKLYPRVGKWLAQGHTQLGGGRGRIQTQAGPIARALSTASVPPLDMKRRLPGCMWTNFTALFTWMALWCCSSALVTPTTPFVLCLWSLISDSVKAPQGNLFPEVNRDVEGQCCWPLVLLSLRCGPGSSPTAAPWWGSMLFLALRCEQKVRCPAPLQTCLGSPGCLSLIRIRGREPQAGTGKGARAPSVSSQLKLSPSACRLQQALGCSQQEWMPL